VYGMVVVLCTFSKPTVATWELNIVVYFDHSWADMPVIIIRRPIKSMLLTKLIFKPSSFVFYLPNL
jgi:hypothetical protein